MYVSSSSPKSRDEESRIKNRDLSISVLRSRCICTYYPIPSPRHHISSLLSSQWSYSSPQKVCLFPWSQYTVNIQGLTNSCKPLRYYIHVCPFTYLRTSSHLADRIGGKIKSKVCSHHKHPQLTTGIWGHGRLMVDEELLKYGWFHVE
jgi:hypothetical protein